MDHQPTYPIFSNQDQSGLADLKIRLKQGEVRRTANVFDLDGDPRALHRLIPLVEAGLLDEVIVHGDVFDRGKKNGECLDAMKKLKSLLGDRFILLLGNHELMMIESRCV